MAAIDAKYAVVAFDADGTLRVPHPLGHDELELMPNVVARIGGIDWRTRRAAIASNQETVSKGLVDIDLAEEMLEVMVNRAFAIPIHAGLFPCLNRAVRHCHQEEMNEARCLKPAPGMLLDICKIYGITPDQMLFVGNLDTDKQAAANAGCAFMRAKDFFGWSPAQVAAADKADRDARSNAAAKTDAVAK